MHDAPLKPKKNGRYRVVCYNEHTDTIYENEMVVDYEMGMFLCQPVEGFEGLHYWLEPVEPQ